MNNSRRNFLKAISLGSAGLLTGPAFAKDEVPAPGRYREAPREIPVDDWADVIVAGGGPAGATALAFQAGRLILLDREEAIAYANRNGIALVGIDCGLPRAPRKTEGSYMHSVRFAKEIACGLLITMLCSLTSTAATPIPRSLFGQNLEHTRQTTEGGLSAQILRNRKFACKPDAFGVAAGWQAFGGHGYYDLLRKNWSITRHYNPKSKMFRTNERGAQLVCCLDADGEKGICQDRLGLRGNVPHEFHAYVRAANPADTVTFRACLKGADGELLFTRDFTVHSKDARDWQKIACTFTPASTQYATLYLSIVGRACGVIGVASILPEDAISGMRSDVIVALKEIGTTIVRWPGGNFAGDYRWQDALIKDRDFRTPIQSYNELETQTDSWGYDSNDLGTDDILTLCEQLGAEPYFTFNLVWDTPEISAEWVKYCGKRVKYWSLGNEMGYAHMEGPSTPEAYTKYATREAEAVLAVNPNLVLTSSGPYDASNAKKSQSWIDGAALPLSKYAKTVSYHMYAQADIIYDFTTPERTEALYAKTSADIDRHFAALARFRQQLPRELAISYDEWNMWYVWRRDDGILEGLFALKMLHNFMQHWEELNLACVCYFQAISELAIRVDPFGCRLTSAGEAMRLAKGHIGGTPVSSLPTDVFATEAPDGSRYVTMYNFSTTQPRTFRIPMPGATAYTGERLTPNGFAISCRYARHSLSGACPTETLEITLQPAEIAAFTARASSSSNSPQNCCRRRDFLSFTGGNQ